MNALRFILCSGILLLGSNVSHSGFTFLGSTPYLSAADSPFNLSGLGTTFFLEDFEDDLLTPGVDIGFPDSTQPLFGNSVDIDDGILDGHDSGGRSVWGYPPDACIGSSCVVQAQWIFNETAFGKYPTAVGIVLTANSGAKATIHVDGFGEGGTESMIIDIENLISNAFNANDDIFIGVTNPFGIYSFTFGQLRRPIPGTTFFNPSFDHLQYGLQVPEPSSIVLAGLALACYSGRVFLPSFL